MHKIRLILTKEAFHFIENLPQKVGDKIYHDINRIEEGEINREIFKKLEGSNIWEFRTLFNKTAYRLFAFWDTEEQALIIATHGIVKKTHKTPTKEINKAERIRTEYFNNKINNKK
ncbi:MAG: type II toxin-antitoxin system RelE/ParE family toxin [Prevotellaceae bacterium]|nr:type II toxin-antitoxin system RelE/ParE family toxin [Prevotellaceae bacterium]